LNQRTAYDPFGLLANPWLFVNIGLQFMRSWQDAWMSSMRLGHMPTGGSLLALRLQASPLARPSLEVEAATRQGRAQPWLGCLTGVQVVGGPESVAPDVIEATAERVVDEPQRPAAKPVVARSPAAPKVKTPPTAVLAKAAPVAVAEPEVLADPVASSVTSMLAMQARSLSKAISKAPKAEAAKPAAKAAVKGDAKKPAAKPAVNKSAVTPAAKKAASKKA
jgi:hypothetical protein